MRLAYAVAAIFAGAFFGSAFIAAPRDGDYQWQRWLGALILHTGRIPSALHAETFSSPGAPWTPHEWAFSIVASLAGPGLGFHLLAAAAGLCALVTMLLVAERARRRHASPLAVATVTALCGIALLASFGVRAQVVAWPLFAIVLLLLDTDDGRAWWAIPVCALWANVHASAVIAPAFACFTAIGALAAGDRRGALLRTALAASLVLAVCATPFGPHLFSYAFGVFSSPMRFAILEWLPTRFDQRSFLFGAFPLALAGAFAGGRFVRRPADLLAFLGTLWMMLGSSRNIATFAIVAAPLVAPMIDVLLARFRDDEIEPSIWRDRVLVAASVASGIALVPAVLAVPVGAPSYAPPRHALAVLDRAPGRHNLFCENYAWCSEALGSKRTRVYLDGRADPYPRSVWSDYDRIITMRDGWRTTIAERRIDAIVARNARPFAKAVAAGRGWRALYADRRYVVFVRSNA